MLDPHNDNLEGKTTQDLKETDEPKSTHFHKNISSIFGNPPSFKLNAGGIKEAINLSYANPNRRGKGELLFKLLSIVSLVLVIFFYARSQKETGRRIKMEGELTEVTTEAKSLQASLGVMGESIKASEQIKTELEQLKNSSAEVSRKLEDISQEKLKLENTLQEKDKKLNELSKQLVELTKIKSDLEDRLKRGQETSKPQEENKSKITSEEMIKKSGKILVVKPANNIVAINLGDKDGIKVGSILDIYGPDNNFVAKLIIDEVEDTISIGKITPQAFVAEVRENYIVKLR